MTTQTSEFMFMIMFNKVERTAQLRAATGGLLNINFGASGDEFIVDVTGTGVSVEIASRQVVPYDGFVRNETSRTILRDHDECKRDTKYEGTLLQALIVGIVADKDGAPSMTFEARKTLSGWQVFGKKYKYVVDTVPDAAV